MGARPSSFKRGGGFLNGVDGVWSDYIWTDEFNGKPFVPGRDPKTKKERFHTLYMLITAQVDGADEVVTTTLFAGGADDFEISADGKTLSNPEGGPVALGASTSVGRFISSLVDAGFPD